MNSNDDGTGGEGRGGGRSGDLSQSHTYGTRLDSSFCSCVFSTFFLHRIAHCALHTVMYTDSDVRRVSQSASQDEDQAESGYIGTYVRCHSRTSGSESAGSLLLSS